MHKVSIQLFPNKTEKKIFGQKEKSLDIAATFCTQECSTPGAD